MENPYFALNPDVFLIRGALRGALYDLKSGNVFSVNPKSVEILEYLEAEFLIRESSGKVGIKLTNVMNYLSQLEKLGLGTFVNENYQRGKIEIKKPAEKLDFIHLELTESCNFHCLHCYNTASPINVYNNEIGFEKWVKVLKDAYELGCKGAQFIGGEPFLRRDILLKLITEAKNIGYKFLEVFSNGSLITDNDLVKLKEFNVHLAVSVYSSDLQVHDQITRNKGSWEKTIKILKRIQEFDIPIRVAIIVMAHNEKSVETTTTFLKNQLSIKDIKVDFVRPAGRGCNTDLVSETLHEKQRFNKPSFQKIDLHSFIRAKYGHHCFSDKICISSTGEVHPCVMEREVSYGNIKKHALIDILATDTAKRFKSLSKDHIDVCRDCEYRYCCFDCRVKSKNRFQNDLYAKPNWCTYNPYIGQWSA